MSAPTYRLPAPATPSVELARGEAARFEAPGAPRRRPSRATYLRRRLVVGLAVLVAAVALVLFGEALSAEAGSGAPVTGGHVVVQPGQTLWEVASANAPAGADVRDYLADLKDLNGLDDGQVAAWAVVLLPRT